MSKLTFCDNPWNLTIREAEALWLLTAFSRQDVSRRTGVNINTLANRVLRVTTKMEAATTAIACIEFDRWWQGAKAGLADAVVLRMEVELLEPAN